MSNPAPTLEQTSAGDSGSAAKFVFVGLSVVACAAALGVGRRLTFLFDPTSLLITLGGTTILLLAVFGVNGCREGMRAWTRRDPEVSAPDSVLAFWRYGATFSLISGMTGTLIGTLLVLSSLQNLANLGPALALTLLSILYGVLQATACACIGARLERRRQTPEGLTRLAKHSLTETSLAVGAAFVLLVVACIGLLRAIEVS